MWTKALLALALSVTLLGCAKKDDSNVTAARTETASSAEAGWKAISTSGVEISFPADWTAIDLTKSDFEKILDEATKNNPQGSQMFNMAKQMAATGMVKLMVLDIESQKDGFVNNANLIVTPSGGMDLDTALNMNKTGMQAQAVKGSEVISKKVKLPAGEAGYMETLMAAPTGGNYLAVSYLVPKDKNMYVMTFGCLEADAKEFKATAEQSMKTMRFTE